MFTTMQAFPDTESDIEIKHLARKQGNSRYRELSFVTVPTTSEKSDALIASIKQRIDNAKEDVADAEGQMEVVRGELAVAKENFEKVAEEMEFVTEYSALDKTEISESMANRVKAIKNVKN